MLTMGNTKTENFCLSYACNDDGIGDMTYWDVMASVLDIREFQFSN